MSWPIVTLKEVSTKVQYGYTASATDEPIGPKFLRITDIVEPQINWERVPHCAIDELDVDRYKLYSGDIVIARTGNTTGYAKLLRDVEESVFASYLVRVRVDDAVADSGYVGRLLESLEYKRFVNGIKGGAAQGNASAQALVQFRFSLPPLAIQRRIATILSTYDDLIENNRKRIKLLERAARLQYTEWFVRMRFPGHEGVKLAKSELGMIPSTWKVLPLGDVCTKIGSGATPRGGEAAYREEGITLIRSMNVYDYEFNTDGLAHIDEEQAAGLNNVNVQEDDILLNITGASVGRCCMVPSRLLPARVNQHVMIVRADSAKVAPSYVLCAINSDSRKAQLLGLAQSGGATREALAKTTVSQFQIVIPDPRTHDAFVEVVDKLFKQRENLESQNVALTRARDLLLPRLMSGKVKV